MEHLTGEIAPLPDSGGNFAANIGERIELCRRRRPRRLLRPFVPQCSFATDPMVYTSWRAAQLGEGYLFDGI